MSKRTFEQEIAEKGKLVYTNVGDSMMPLIKQGRDLIVIKKAEGRLKRYDVPLYKRDNGQYVLHRILWVRKNDYLICGDNRYGVECGITDRHIIGVLSEVIRDGKTVKVTDLRYKLYVHLWCDLFLVRAGILYIKRKVEKARRLWKKTH